MNEESQWREFLHAEAEDAPTQLRPGQLDRAIRRGRRRRTRLMGAVGAVVCALGVGTAVALPDGGSDPGVERGCATVPVTSPDARDLVTLTVTVRGPLHGKTVPITARWSSKDRPIVIITGPAFQRAYLLDRQGAVVARIAPDTYFIDPGEEHSITGHASVAAGISEVSPLVTCSGRPASALPQGNYRLVVAASADVAPSDLKYVPHEGGDFLTIVSAPVPVEIR